MNEFNASKRWKPPSAASSRTKEINNSVSVLAYSSINCLSCSSVLCINEVDKVYYVEPGIFVSTVFVSFQ